MNELKLLGIGESFQETVSGLIAHTSFFSDLEHAEIEILMQWSKAYSAPTGTFILKEGDENTCLCIIMEGEINIFKESTNNEHMKIADIKVGETIGEMGIVDGQPFSASAIASKDSVILLITRTDFKNLVRRHGNLGNKLLWKIAKIISLRLRQTTVRLADLLTN
jgi:CRP-like cAMP-binding protein